MESLVRPAFRVKRAYCTTCKRPQSTCICQWISPTVHQVEVVVLQHPLEVANAKGSARLLHLSLPHSRLVTGEVFSEQALQALLTAPQQPATQAHGPKHPILLYPATPQDKALGMPVSTTLAPELLCNPSQLRLIVLDGTWRKSRKMLYLNPLLQRLPRLSLSDMPASGYLIRKAHGADQLSTLEATCAALMQLEGSIEQFRPLLSAFDGFVAQQSGYQRGPEQSSRSSD
jgi:DTW domain-containing protein YfiP